MNVARSFLLVGIAYLLAGMVLGSYMGAAGDHTLAPVHAHINLLGFTLMAVFAAIYRVFPAMLESSLARYHFWLHQVGTFVLLGSLFLTMAGLVSEDSIALLFPIAELSLIAATAIFGWNALSRAR